MNDDTAIREALQRYCDLLYSCDVGKFDDVFHANAQLQAVGPQGYTCWSSAQYKEVLRKRASPAAAGAIREDEIIAIDQSSDVSAAAKLKVLINGVRFCDYLSLLKIDGDWRIVAKVYCVLPGQ